MCIIKLMIIPKQRKKSILGRNTAQEECDFVTAVLMGVETAQNFKKYVNVGCRQANAFYLHFK